MPGLANLGNTCFFNSALQALLQTPELEATRSSAFTSALAALREGAAVGPRAALDAFAPLMPRYRIGSQEDSAEALVLMLDAMDARAADVVLETRVTGACGHTSVTRVAERVLHAPLAGAHTSLLSALQALQSPQVLDGDNAWACNACRTKVAATTTTTVVGSSPVLAISLGRFAADGRSKDARAVDVPSELIVSGSCYSLHGWIHHSGGLGGGHYVYYGKGLDGQWRCFNDSSVSQVTAAHAAECSRYGYVCLYRRVGQNPLPTPEGTLTSTTV